ncbi:MAG: bifunctional (p)ppGpp synthetase/guanosine-3',5'-bis(diphosphate) 3'-pyrophosphohydrolase, partial [Actinobacteria bacterium]|nr:bifunctional (p)ppGpp synthetase/guanosine-3',5'-bis(diphosphate) 3'-pyrophosphohydrolase [Actinomycetota bacterium]
MFAGLVAKVKSYNPQLDEKLLTKAYEIAKKYHDTQYRKSGEPFISHPIEVAKILADIELDQTSIIAAILHDLIEDTEFTYEKVKKEFGAAAANIINGVTKLDKIVFSSREERQVENLRKMIIAMSEDVRIILIKLADRLHNMRTLSSVSKEKRQLKAIETLEVYAPLAHRLGIYQVKSELEDLSFQALYPKRYAKIKEMVIEKIKLRKDIMDNAINVIAEKLKEVNIQADISGREKTYYSIYNKITQQNRRFDDIYDLLAVRIIVEDVKSCYAALGIIHSIWKPVPGRFKDYIANPKFNMYQSLHTTVISSKGDPLEIQIRTFEMHKFAEYGIAAHYKYKEGILKPTEFDKRITWIRQLLDWQKELKDPQEYMESLKMDLFAEEIFVFTPKGRVVNLPRGATPIDFAYQIHTDIGHNCIGAKVDGSMVPLESRLENGNIVEVIVSKTPKGPSRDWLGIVKTTSARNKIRQWFSKEERLESYNTGRELMLKTLRKNSLAFKDIPSKVFEEVAKELNFENIDSLFRNIGSHKVSTHQVFTKIIKNLNQSEEREKEIGIEDIAHKESVQRTGSSGVIVKGMDGVLVTIARCCNPVPGDKIMGYITRGRGISVHRTDCNNIKTLMKNEEQRFIEVKWDSFAPHKFNAEIQIEAMDRTKLLRDVTNVISEYDLNIINASTLRTNKSGLVKFRFIIEISNKYILKDILNNLKQIESVYDVYRVLP